MEVKKDMFYLGWKEYNSEMIGSFDKLRLDDTFTDVTLACETMRATPSNGFQKFRQFKAHKLLLSISSPYFNEILVDNPCSHPVVMIRETKAEELEAVLEFIYTGQTKIRHENLVKFMKAARFLQIRGLVEVGEDQLKEQNARLTLENKTKEAPKKRPIVPKRKADFVLSDYDTDDSDFNSGNPYHAPAGPYRPGKQRKVSHYPPKPMPKQEPEEDDDWDFGGESYKPPCPVASKIKKDSGQGQFECDKCDRSYICPSSLKKHQQVHSGATTCKFCYKVLSRVLELKRHLKKRHGYQMTEDNPDPTA